MADHITPLNKVDALCDGTKIRVRVSRLWHHQSSYSASENNAIEMIFVDEEGDRMHATIMKRYISRFEGSLVEGHVYYISNFGVAENTARFKMVAHDHKISFYRATKVVEFPGDFRGPLYGFQFADYADVLNFKVNADSAFDIIGVLHSCGKIQPKMVDGRDSKLITFELESIE